MISFIFPYHTELNVNTSIYPIILGGRSVPQRIVCRKCGEVLYSGLELLPPEDVIRRYGGRCPRCGNKLHFDPENLEIKVYKKYTH